jgi:hypothetical protein
MNPGDDLDDNSQDLLMTVTTTGEDLLTALMTTGEDLLMTLMTTGEDLVMTRDDDTNHHCDDNVLLAS